MYTVKSDKEFFEQFQLLELKIRELSCLFQNSFIGVSKEEVNEWREIASTLQYDLSKLIKEGNSRFNLIK